MDTTLHKPTTGETAEAGKDMRHGTSIQRKARKNEERHLREKKEEMRTSGWRRVSYRKKSKFSRTTRWA